MAKITTPLIDFLRQVSERRNLYREEARVIRALNNVAVLPERAEAQLEKMSTQFSQIVRGLGWHDLPDWIQDEVPSYQASIEDLAGAAQLRHAYYVTGWNNKLRDELDLDHWIKMLQRRKILCAFSSAVDATLDLGQAGRNNLDTFLDFAANFASLPKAELLSKGRDNYQRDKHDRKDVSTVEDVIAELMFGFENPNAYLKPNLEPESDAERLMREFYIAHGSRLNRGGGGASLNIADVLAALRCEVHTFWPYHSSELASASLCCLGGRHVKELRRCWFANDWCWEDSPFDEPGAVRDGTPYAHPVRMSIPVSFGKKTKPIPSSPQVRPAGPGRVIFQFKGYRSADFFLDKSAAAGEWDLINFFCRWRGKNAVTQLPPAEKMSEVSKIDYHRIILSGFQRQDKKTLRRNVNRLSAQCADLPIHHEISARFDSRDEVETYSWILQKVFDKARRKTAGMNPEELRAFTSWPGTDAYEALTSVWPESLVERCLRAARVRQLFDLDWMYVHGAELDIAIVKESASVSTFRELRSAMLFAKVAVFSALHVRSRKTAVPRDFEPCCSPKGILALYRFAHDFSRKFVKSSSRRQAVQDKILRAGFVTNAVLPPGKAGIVVAPVYWPPPQKGMSPTGAGDICSGLVAALGP